MLFIDPTARSCAKLTAGSREPATGGVLTSSQSAGTSASSGGIPGTDDLSGQIRRETDLTSYFRGGTYLLGSAELRFAPRGRDRVGPFAVAGFAAGLSRPNVNEVFRTPAANGARAVFGGGGVLVPLGQRLTASAEVRMLIGTEGSEGILAVAPVRVGVAWRF